MPYSPLRPCTFPGCGNLVESGRCPRHKPKDTRESAHKRGYDKAWQRFRKQWLSAHPFCEIKTHCNGAFANEVDHIEPLQIAPHRKYDETNLQSTCKRCHSAKTMRESRS